jgi:deoxyribodipyrimidine photo-lyase
MLEATREAGLTRLNLFVAQRAAGEHYARFRNEVRLPHGRVSLLSPYLRHRLVLETEVLQAVLQHESAVSAEKFIQEVCWRTYWKGWLELHPQVWSRYVVERDQLLVQSSGLSKAALRAINGQTGIECFDDWSRELQETGYLHNHARMWFASIWIFTLNLPWQLGADFFMQHLVDADAASNTLSWRWVAGLQTVGKHYLARAENIARYTGNRYNPRGQLNETAQALHENPTTANQQSDLKTAPLFSRATFNAVPSKLPVSRAASARPLLVLHDDDLDVTSFAQLTEIAGIVVLQSAQYRANGAQGQSAANFSTAALHDAKVRAMAHFQLNEQQVIECAEPRALAAQLDGHTRFGDSPIVMCWPSVGPTRDALAIPLSRWREQNRAVSWLVRPWDRFAWPFANKGFFQFRTRIPELLREFDLQ